MNMNRKLMPDLSMTKVEELLRQYWNDTHKDYNAKILSPKELDEYISKMLMDFLPRNDIMLSPDELPDFLTHNKNLPLPQLPSRECCVLCRRAESASVILKYTMRSRACARCISAAIPSKFPRGQL